MRSLQGFPWLAHVYADYFRLNDLAMASHLEQKSHPARKAAEHAREVAEKRRIAEKLWRVLKYQLEYYETDAFTLAHHPRLRRASGAHRIDGVGKPLAFALHALPAGNLTFAGGIERSVVNLDLTLSLVMADDQAIWRDAGPSQLERMRRRAVGEQFFAAAKHDRHCEDAHCVDQVIGEQRVDEFGTALGDEVRAVFLLQALHVGDVAQEH